MPTIKVLLFAAAREAAGNVSSLDLDLPDESSDTAALRYGNPCIILFRLFY